jgi:uncharacterized protein
MSSIDQQFVEYIVKSLVGNPDAVKIERRIDEKGVLLELTVDPDDLGRVIGKRGATAQSIRSLLRALGTKNDARYNLKIVDNGPPREERYRPAEPSSAPVANDNITDNTSDDNVSDDKPAEESTKQEAKKPALDDSEDWDEEEVKETKASDDSLSKTRKELEELDDLDV